MTSANWLSIVGLALNLVGVALLFGCAMPYALRNKGLKTFILDTPDTEQRALQSEWSALGVMGLACFVLGTLAQIAAIALP